MSEQTFVMNGEPLSTKQLHELITAQRMTIDSLLTKNGELVDAMKRIVNYRIDDHDKEWEQDDDLDYVQSLAKKALGMD